MFILNFLPLLITVFGFYFLFKLKFFLFIHPIRVVKQIKQTLSVKSNLSALYIALAGTLGVGNILGVAYGIISGGPGVVFWIFISGIFSSVIKYSETVICREFREAGSGGMMSAIRKSFKKTGGVLACLYAVFALCLSLVMGSALQSKSVIDTLDNRADKKIIYAFLFTALVIVVVVFGSKAVKIATTFIIPFSTVAYIVLCVVIIAINFAKLPSVFLSIIKDAFDIRSMTGGVSVFCLLKVLREGYCRGILSNEAGAGTSSMAQTECTGSSVSGGIIGVLEVFFDTTVLCSLSGFAILCSVENIENYKTGISLVVDAVRVTLGAPFVPLLSFLIFTFAYATVISWFYYGGVCINYLKLNLFYSLYKTVFVFVTFIGFMIPEGILMSASDFLLLSLSFITLITLKKNSERIVYLSENHGLI